AQAAEQHAEDRRVDERRACEVDDDGLAAVERRCDLLAQGRRGVHVVLAGDDDDRDLAVELGGNAAGGHRWQGYPAGRPVAWGVIGPRLPVATPFQTSRNRPEPPV